MFKTEVDKIADSSEKKIAYMKKSPFGYIILSSLAGIYLGFGIVLIFSIGGPIAAAGGGAYLKLIMVTFPLFMDRLKVESFPFLSGGSGAQDPSNPERRSHPFWQILQVFDSLALSGDALCCNASATLR